MSPARPEIEWRLAQVMRLRGVTSVGELRRRLGEAGVPVSSSHLYRLYHAPPDTLPLLLLLTLARVLDCELHDLVRLPPSERAAPAKPAASPKALTARVRKVPFQTFQEIIAPGEGP